MAKQVFGQLAIFEPSQNFAGGGETARVEIYGAIGWDVYGPDFLRALNALPDTVGDIDLRIHSYGGSVTEGWAIAQALKNHKATVTGTVEGTAASMASVIAMSCDRLVMAKNSYLMIHRVTGGAVGDADEMDNAARTVRQMESDIVNFYAEKTGIETEEIREMMARETWLNGEEAFELGFCHEVTGEVQAVALVGEKNVVAEFGHVPAAIAMANGLEDVQAEEETEEDTDETEVTENDSQNEEVTDETPDESEENDVAPSGAIGSVLGRLKNLIGGAGDGPVQNVAALTAENGRLIAEVENLTADRDAAVMERDTLRDRLETLEAEARTVEAMIAECGFSRAEAEALPAPCDEEDSAGARSEAAVLDQVNSMAPGEARRKFYRENNDQILKLQLERGE
jgi:ATP-dependent Clp endopeptidase proteolytic subunit ClpP